MLAIFKHINYNQILSAVKTANNGWIPEWPKGTDCKSAASCFGGSNPPPSIKPQGLCRRGGTGRRTGLKILRD